MDLVDYRVRCLLVGSFLLGLTFGERTKELARFRAAAALANDPLFSPGPSGRALFTPDA